MGEFLPTFHPWFSLALWAPPKPSSKLGNIRNHDLSRIFPVTAHSEGKEAQKLDTFGEFRGSSFSSRLDMEDGFFWDFTLAGKMSYNLIV